MNTNVVQVKLWGMTVGFLLWDKVQKVSIFEYDPDFLNTGLDIAPLSMSIYSARSQKQLPWIGDGDKLYQGLPPMLADSLPDKWGNSLFNAWLKNNGIRMRDVTPVDHLSFIGSRAMGAFEYEPAQKLGNSSSFDVDVQRLYNFAKDVIEERKEALLTSESSILWQDLIKISSSPGGKRPKVIVAINPNTGEIKSGQALVPDGFEHYILKYDDNSGYPYAKLEYVYYRMALLAGIEMMPSELRNYSGITHFLTKRFDRIGNDKIHVQTLAAMSPGCDSYDDIFAVMRKLNLPHSDHQQQYLRLVFNVLARNVDDHSKNFAFCMNPDGVWRLSPAYDLTYSVDIAAPNYMNRHSLLINGKDDGVTRKDLELVGQRNDIKDYIALIESVRDALTKFAALSREIDVPEQVISAILQDMYEQ